MQMILASASPRRRELLARIEPQFTVAVSSVDESGICAETPALLAQTLAAAKCRDIAAQHPDACVIGCDTVVDVDGTVLGKPADAQDAARMLHLLSGRSHFVHTGVCIAANGAVTQFTESTCVHFMPLTDAEIAAYVASGDAFDKAGAYGVQSGAAPFVTRIEGCFYNVVGFPLSAVYTALQNLRGAPDKRLV